jgi:hypothetical protein
MSRYSSPPISAFPFDPVRLICETCGHGYAVVPDAKVVEMKMMRLLGQMRNQRELVCEWLLIFILGFTPAIAHGQSARTPGDKWHLCVTTPVLFFPLTFDQSEAPEAIVDRIFETCRAEYEEMERTTKEGASKRKFPPQAAMAIVQMLRDTMREGLIEHIRKTRAGEPSPWVEKVPSRPKGK